jgi:hypothetical protein
VVKAEDKPMPTTGKQPIFGDDIDMWNVGAYTHGNPPVQFAVRLARAV